MAAMSQTLLISNQVNNTTTVDYISQLPDEILTFILSLLITRDAVNTRILSRRWRNLCVCLPMSDLKFCNFTMFVIGYEGVYIKRNLSIFKDKKGRFVDRVNQFLLPYRVAKINSFRAWFCLGKETACYLNRWISFEVTMGTEKLDLNFSSIPQNSELSFHSFSHSNTSPLEHLCLESYIVTPSPDSLDRLNFLKTLYLIDVVLDQSCLNSLFTGCVNLEWFRLARCSLPVTLFICSQLLQLKFLFVEDCGGVENIELSSINLTTFEYIGDVINFTFVEVPWLEKVFFHFLHAFERGTNYMFNELPNNLPRLQILSLCLTTCEVLPLPASMTRFNNLTKLELVVYVSTDFDILSITSIINACPLLEKFHLALHSGSCRGLRRETDYLRLPHFRLKEIEISGFCNRYNAMALAKYLLNHAVALEQFIVESVRKMYHGGNEWSLYPLPRLMDDSELERVHSLLLKEKVNPRTEVYVR